MHFEIAKFEFEKILSAVDDVYKDPLLFAVIEGNRPGRIFVDDRNLPQAGFVWTNTECAYLVGKASEAAFYRSIFDLISEEFIPKMESNGETFLSIFTFNQADRQRVLSAFDDRHPLSLELATYRMDQQTPPVKRSETPESLTGFVLSPLDRSVLDHSENQGLAGQITYYWGSVEMFLENGLGTCLLKDGLAASWCFSEAFGANAHSVNIVTRHEFRRRGFAHFVGLAFIDLCLESGTELAWLCDESNRPAKALAESLGLRYVENLYPVDIPFSPDEFYLQVADHLSDEFENPDQAAALYAIAAELQEVEG
jgi:hypothetical protein